MSTLSEIIIKPGKSKTYIRLLLVLYLLSFFLLFNSSLYWQIKGIIIAIIFLQLGFDYSQQNPCPTIQELRGSKKKWLLVMNNGAMQVYDDACVLIHNPLFQLIALSRFNKKKCFILFNDQLSKNQLRLLHFKMAADK